MEQVATYLSGERDYTAIKGATGPLVYPAAHLYIYSLLFYLTDGGNNILLAQMLFGGLYLATLALVLACYRKAEVSSTPVWVAIRGDSLILLVYQGPTIYIPSVDIVQTPPQHLLTPSL